MIDIYLLEQLVAVRKHETLAAAAESMNISQPAISKSMKKLEDLMDMSLFTRSNRKTVLNRSGVFFADRAADYLSLGENLLDQVRAYDRTLRNISIGSCTPFPFWELTPALSSLFPKMSITAQTDDDEHLIRGLRQNLYQLILTSIDPEDDDLFSAHFKTETMSLSVPRSHPFYNREKIAPVEMDGQFLIVYEDIGIWEKWIHEYFPKVHLMSISEADALREAIGLGTALSFVSDYVADMGYGNKDQKIIPLDMENKTISYFLVCKKKDHTKYRAVFQRLIKR